MQTLAVPPKTGEARPRLHASAPSGELPLLPRPAKLHEYPSNCAFNSLLSLLNLFSETRERERERGREGGGRKNAESNKCSPPTGTAPHSPRLSAPPAFAVAAAVLICCCY
ncbi:hypothetical protein BHE74_00034575 [Ensete ventricosum]|nr:hypothetical protein BHE74_00034575 [Ensete ventricosum]